MLRGGNAERPRKREYLRNAPIKEHRLLSFLDLIEQIQVSGEQQFAEFCAVLPRRSVAADTNLFLNDCASGFVDAQKSPRLQGFYYRRFACTRASGHNIKIVSLSKRQVSPPSSVN